MVIAHFDCGMRGLTAQSMLDAAQARGIPADRIETLRHAGIDLDSWFTGFDNVEQSVRHTVNMIRHHPLMPSNVVVHGLVIHPSTGKLTLIEKGQRDD